MRSRLLRSLPSFNVLAIETSCDDTAVAIVSTTRKVLAQKIMGQNASHQPYHGIVPRLAAQLHRANLPLAISDCISEAGLSGIQQIDAIAATRGPGLANCLSAGFLAGRSIAAFNNLPFYGIHHMEGHALTARLTNMDLHFPFLALLISGGHTLLLLVHGVGQYTILGTTTDDSVGEALDKATRTLGIPWTGNQGPAAALEAYAKNYTEDPSADFNLPLPLKDESRPTLNFSFSGLKTALKYHIESLETLDQHQRKMLAYKFQQRATDHLENRLRRAIEIAKEARCLSVVISGGVARNQYIRKRLGRTINESGLNSVFAPFEYCSDNAVMIGWAAIENILAGKKCSDPDTDAEVLPDWPLDDLKLDL